jgi:sortase A
VTGGTKWGRLVKRVALTLVGTGLLLLSFVAYQLWGTALYEHHAQDQLRNELAGKLHSPTATTSPAPTAPSSTTPGATTTTAPPAVVSQVAPTTPDPGVGTPIGLMTIPAIGMNGAAIVEGTAENQLQQGPGHYVGTPLPGQAGNAAIAGHRTTYGAPFYDLNELQPGDAIKVQTAQGSFTYQVVTSHVVVPTNTAVLDASTTPELTLTTCNPRYSAAQRLVVMATLTATSLTAPSIPATTQPTATTTTGPSSLPQSLGGGVGEGGGLVGVSTGGEVGQAVLWGVLTLLAAILGAIGWRRGRRPWSWVVLGMGVPLTVAALLVCFQHISLALPQSF